MSTYEELLQLAADENISVDENYSFKGNLSGLYVDGNIALSDRIPTTTEKACVLAEELGHYYTSSGDIIDLSDESNRKQELRARLHAYNMQIGLLGIILAYEAHRRTRYEIADFLDVPEEYLAEALDCYRAKYGIYTQVDNYIIYFIPALSVVKVI